MELNKTTKRLVAARRPFSVVEIKNAPHITKVNGKQSAYNIVGKNGYGVAEFGCDELAATWFCEAANRYADEIYRRRSTTPHTGRWLNDKDHEYAKLREALKAAKQYLDGYSTNILELRRKVSAALAEPPAVCRKGKCRNKAERFLCNDGQFPSGRLCNAVSACCQVIPRHYPIKLHLPRCGTQRKVCLLSL